MIELYDLYETTGSNGLPGGMGINIGVEAEEPGIPSGTDISDSMQPKPRYTFSKSINSNGWLQHDQQLTCPVSTLRFGDGRLGKGANREKQATK